MRFHNGIYRDCKWCNGRGCLQCKTEADKAYKREFPDGPKPILTIRNEEFDAFAISESTGGPSIVDAHGPLGALAARVFEEVQKRKIHIPLTPHSPDATQRRVHGPAFASKLQ